VVLVVEEELFLQRTTQLRQVALFLLVQVLVGLQETVPTETVVGTRHLVHSLQLVAVGEVDALQPRERVALAVVATSEQVQEQLKLRHQELHQPG
jgi:hypothetical protein